MNPPVGAPVDQLCYAKTQRRCVGYNRIDGSNIVVIAPVVSKAYEINVIASADLPAPLHIGR